MLVLRWFLASFTFVFRTDFQTVSFKLAFRTVVFYSRLLNSFLCVRVHFAAPSFQGASVRCGWCKCGWWIYGFMDVFLF